MTGEDKKFIKDEYENNLSLASLLKMVADRDRKIHNIDLRLRRVEQHLGLLTAN
mgnify:CR=1 FL=1